MTTQSCVDVVERNPAAEALEILNTVAAAEGQSTRFGRGKERVKDAIAEIIALRSQLAGTKDLLEVAENINAEYERVSKTLAEMMVRHSFATGPLSTLEALVSELDWQIRARDEQRVTQIATARSEGERVGIALTAAKDALRKIADSDPEAYDECCGSGVQTSYDEPPECCAQPIRDNAAKAIAREALLNSALSASAEPTKPEWVEKVREKLTRIATPSNWSGVPVDSEASNVMAVQLDEMQKLASEALALLPPVGTGEVGNG